MQVLLVNAAVAWVLQSLLSPFVAFEDIRANKKGGRFYVVLLYVTFSLIAMQLRQSLELLVRSTLR